MDTHPDPHPTHRARNLLCAAMALVALSATFVPTQAGPTLLPTLMSAPAAAPPLHALPALAAPHAQGTCPAPYVGNLPSCACPPGSVGSFPTGCKCAPGSFGTPPSCSPCPPPPGPPGPHGGCTCPPSNPNCCPGTVGPDCCQAGQVPPNHCCGAQYNPTGDPAQCCSLYRTVQNCCSTFPASDPVLCLCLQQGICGPLAEPEPQAQATQPADPQVPVTGQASAPPERAPVRVAGHAAAA